MKSNAEPATAIQPNALRPIDQLANLPHIIRCGVGIALTAGVLQLRHGGNGPTSEIDE